MDPNKINLDLNSYLDKIAQQTQASNKVNSESPFNSYLNETIQQDMDGLLARDRYFYNYFLFKYKLFIKVH